jgi:hypothetical protein
MASGCIIGECLICGGLIWEDESYTIDNRGNLYHIKCVNSLRKRNKKLKELHKEDEINE